MDISKYLSKTDFKIARECPIKLYYARKRYLSKKDTNEYLEFLKEGGHIIGEMARVLHPEGIYVGLAGDLEGALEKTKKELEKDNVILFEAVVANKGMLAVIDILEKNGNDVNLIEVKSKSYDSNEENQIVGKKGGIKGDWLEYIEDVAFQVQVLKGAFPTFSVVPYLMLPDKSKVTNTDFLASYFEIKTLKQGDKDYYRVTYTGDRDALIKDNFLTKVNVKDACSFIAPLVQLESNKFIQILNPELKKPEYHLGKHCKECEFRTDDGNLSGFHECWNELAEVRPHLFDLYYGGALKKDGKYVFDDLISQKKVSLYDVPQDLIKGKRGERQTVQINFTRSNKEWINPEFKYILDSYKYPHHFIDFETSTTAVPYHKGMRPYEQIAFQWSCHTVLEEGAAPVHSEWINLEDSFPSFKFVKSLKETISEEGTIFMWAQHESLVLRDIRRQMTDYDFQDPEIADWIDSVVSSEDKPGRLVDMNRLCIENYFHPMMKGKTSIKYVLPAIWNNNDYLWELPFLKSYLRKGDDGNILSPYHALEDVEIGGMMQIVREGTGAMSAYQEMMYGLSRSDKDYKEKWSKLLRQYCKLDTLAMLIIFLHWKKLLS